MGTSTDSLRKSPMCAREKQGCHECPEISQELGTQELLWGLEGSPLPNLSMSLGFWKAPWVPCLGSFTGEAEAFCIGNASIKFPFVSQQIR